MISFLVKEKRIQIGRKEAEGVLNLLHTIKWKSESVRRIFILAFSAPVYSVTRRINLAGPLFRRVLNACRVNGPTFWRLNSPTSVGRQLIEFPIRGISGSEIYSFSAVI